MPCAFHSWSEMTLRTEYPNHVISASCIGSYRRELWRYRLLSPQYRHYHLAMPRSLSLDSDFTSTVPLNAQQQDGLLFVAPSIPLSVPSLSSTLGPSKKRKRNVIHGDARHTGKLLLLLLLHWLGYEVSYHVPISRLSISPYFPPYALF